MSLPRLLLAGLAVGLVACGSSSSEPLSGHPAATRVGPVSSLLRLPRSGGSPSLLTVPALEPMPWQLRDRLPALRRAVGVDLDQAIAFALDSTGTLVGIDLEGGRMRPYLTGIRQAGTGPDGSVFAVGRAGEVTRIHHRAPQRLRGRLAAAPVQLFGTTQRGLIAVLASDTARLALVEGQDGPLNVALPQGSTAATFWGDLIAVATDSGVMLYDPTTRKAPRELPGSNGAATVAFSPSGHRLYVGLARGGLAVFDRYSEDRVARIGLPGVAAAMRPDPYGGWLLLRPEQGDSIWLVSLATNKLVGRAATDWSDDLPAVVDSRYLLTRQGQDMVVLDLSEDGFPVAGRSKGGARDLWLPLAWTPGRDQPREAPDQAAARALPTEGATYYVQVSSSRNPAWAQDLVNQLRGAGVNASALPPAAGEDAYRVVVGPYPTREEAEEAGRKLGRPSFIYQPGQSAGDR